MKKKDLKTGMLVETRDEGIYLVINDEIVKKDDWVNLFDYDDNFISIDGLDEFDIIAVSNVLIGGALRAENWNTKTLYNDLLWERKEEIEKQK